MSSLDDISKYIDDGDYKKAIEELDILISKEPDNAKAFYMRGKVMLICEECGSRNYSVHKSQNVKERLTLKKYCSHCNKMTIHKESR